MNNIFTFFPKIDTTIFKLLNFSSKFEFSFFNQNTNEIENLDINIDDNKFISFGDEIEWSPFVNDLNVKMRINIENFGKFFGAEGVAPTGSKIGLALECVCQKSKFRKVFNFSTIDENNIGTTELNFVIPKKTISGSLELTLICYLKESSKLVDENEIFLNNDSGVILGSLDKKIVLFEGRGALFPIYNRSSNNPKLWDIEINYDDPEVDKVVDSVKLILNNGHEDYCYVDPSNPKYCKRIVDEIVSTALIIFIGRLREDGVLNFDLNKDYQNGSILSFIKFLKKGKEFNINSITEFSSSIREFLEKED